MNKKIVVLGDSHARYFESSAKLEYHAPWVKRLNVDVNKIPASTIIGLGKKRSTLNLSSKVDGVLKSHENSYRVFAFGQVDLELGFYYKKVVKGEDINLSGFVVYLIGKYKDFLGRYDNGNLVVKGLNLTVLKHEGFALEYVKRIITENVDDKDDVLKANLALKEVFDSFSARNSATIMFNNQLKDLACERGWRYFDVNDELSSYSPGKGINDEFIPAGFDHHLVDSVYMRKLHLSALRKCL